MLDAHVRAAALVGSPFASGAQPFDFGAQERSTAAAPSSPIAGVSVRVPRSVRTRAAAALRPDYSDYLSCNLA